MALPYYIANRRMNHIWVPVNAENIQKRYEHLRTNVAVQINYFSEDLVRRDGTTVWLVMKRQTCRVVLVNTKLKGLCKRFFSHYNRRRTVSMTRNAVSISCKICKNSKLCEDGRSDPAPKWYKKLDYTRPSQKAQLFLRRPNNQRFITCNLSSFIFPQCSIVKSK